MSRRATNISAEVARLRSEIAELKADARRADTSDISAPTAASTEFEKLSPVEQSAASLGVNPVDWKPIAFLNNAHYRQLISANMLDDDLARRIEVQPVPTNQPPPPPVPRLSRFPLRAQAFRAVASS